MLRSARALKLEDIRRYKRPNSRVAAVATLTLTTLPSFIQIGAISKKYFLKHCRPNTVLFDGSDAVFNQDASATLVFTKENAMVVLKVLCSIGLQGAYASLKPEMEKRAGVLLDTDYGVATTFKKNIEEGVEFDVAILTQQVIAGLVADDRVVPTSVVDIARSGLGVAVRSKAPKPDIDTVDSLTKTLLAAGSIASSANGLAGFYFLDVLDTLNIADQIKPKLKLETTGGYAAEITARGDAEMAVQLISEIMPVTGVELVGPFPKALQKYAILSAGVSTRSKHVAAAHAIIQFLASPLADGPLKLRGLDRCE
jgi:molybdate transport system substrate-binding protein